MKTCIKCNKQHPHMVSLCADCHKQINTDAITNKRAAEIGAAFVSNFHTIRKTVEGWRDEADCAMVQAVEANSIKASLYEYERNIYKRVLDLFDN